MSEKTRFIIQSGFYYPEKNHTEIKWLMPEQNHVSYKTFEAAEEVCRNDEYDDLYECEYNFAKITEVHFTESSVKARAVHEWIYIYTEEYFDEIIHENKDYGKFKLYCEQELDSNGKILKTVKYKEVKTKQWLVNYFKANSALYAFAKASFSAEQQELLDLYYAGDLLISDKETAEIIKACDNLIITYGKYAENGMINFKELEKGSAEDKFLTPLFMVFERSEEEYDFIVSVETSDIKKCPKLLDRHHSSVYAVAVSGLDVPLLQLPLENCDLITVAQEEHTFDYFEEYAVKSESSFFNCDDTKKSFLCREHKKLSDLVYNILLK